MNPLLRGVYRVHTPSRSLFNHQRRRVSRMVWDTFGFRKDGTDYAKRASCAEWMHAHPIQWRIWWFSTLWGGCIFVMWAHGVFDYAFRSKNIKPLEPDWTSDNPFRPPKGYENPMFEPARKWAKVREAKRKDWEENPTDRPGYFSTVLKRPKWHKYRTGGR
eukprot:451837_1